jgi:hypothetical protein
MHLPRESSTSVNFKFTSNNEGQSVDLDGLEDRKLKASLKQLFQLAGLELVEMEANEEDTT